MIIERNDKEIVIRIQENIDPNDLQQFLNYVRYREITSGFNIVQEEADSLAKEINAGWKAKNNQHFSE